MNDGIFDFSYAVLQSVVLAIYLLHIFPFSCSSQKTLWCFIFSCNFGRDDGIILVLGSLLLAPQL